MSNKEILQALSEAMLKSNNAVKENDSIKLVEAECAIHTLVKELIKTKK